MTRNQELGYEMQLRVGIWKSSWDDVKSHPLTDGSGYCRTWVRDWIIIINMKCNWELGYEMQSWIGIWYVIKNWDMKLNRELGYETQSSIGRWNSIMNWDMKRTRESGYETQLTIWIWNAFQKYQGWFGAPFWNNEWRM